MPTEGRDMKGCLHGTAWTGSGTAPRETTAVRQPRETTAVSPVRQHHEWRRRETTAAGSTPDILQDFHHRLRACVGDALGTCDRLSWGAPNDAQQLKGPRHLFDSISKVYGQIPTRLEQRMRIIHSQQRCQTERKRFINQKVNAKTLSRPF